MNHLTKKFISIVLVLSILMGFASTIFASEEPLKYLTIGDSYSNGYKFNHYEGAPYDCDEHILLENTYPELFGDYLEEKTGRKVQVYTSLAQSGFRAIDVLAYLSGIDGYEEKADALTRYWQGWNAKEEYMNKCIDEVTNADVITIKLGFNNIISYLRAVAFKDFGIDTGFPVMDGTVERTLNDEQKKMLEAIKNDLKDIVEENLDPEILSEIEGGINSVLDYKLGSTYTIGDYIDVLAYVIVGTCLDHDNLLDKIYELNPDVEIYVLSLENPFENIELVYTNDNDEEINIPFGKMVGSSLDLLNLYYSVLSEYSNKIYYVNNLETPQMFADKVVADDDFAKLYAKYTAEEFVDDSQTEVVAGQIWQNVQASLGVNKFSLNDIVEDVKALDLSALSSLFDTEKLRDVIFNFDESSTMEKFLLKCYLMVFVDGGSGCHPSANGHKVMFDSLAKCYDEHKVLEEAIVYHYIISVIPESAYQFMYAKSLDAVKVLIKCFNDSYKNVKAFCDKIKETAEEAVSPQAVFPAVSSTTVAPSKALKSAVSYSSINSKISSSVKRMLR